MEQIDPQAKFEVGNGATAEGRSKYAVVHYRRALRAAHELVEIHHNQAVALKHLQRLDEVVEVAPQGPGIRVG